MTPRNMNDGATGPRKKFDDIFNRLYTIHDWLWQTDRRTTADTHHYTTLTHSVAW